MGFKYDSLYVIEYVLLLIATLTPAVLYHETAHQRICGYFGGEPSGIQHRTGDFFVTCNHTDVYDSETLTSDQKDDIFLFHELGQSINETTYWIFPLIITIDTVGFLIYKKLEKIHKNQVVLYEKMVGEKDGE